MNMMLGEGRIAPPRVEKPVRGGERDAYTDPMDVPNREITEDRSPDAPNTILAEEPGEAILDEAASAKFIAIEKMRPGTKKEQAESAKRVADRKKADAEYTRYLDEMEESALVEKALEAAKNNPSFIKLEDGSFEPVTVLNTDETRPDRIVVTYFDKKTGKLSEPGEIVPRDFLREQKEHETYALEQQEKATREAEQAEAKLTENIEGRGERLLSDTLANVEAVNKALADKVAKAGKLFSGRATKFLTKALGAGTQVTERARLFVNDVAGGSDAAEEQAPHLEEMRIPFQLPKETISATIKRAGEEMVWLKNVLTRQEKGIDWAKAEIPDDTTAKVSSELAEGLGEAGEEFFGIEKSVPAAEEKMVEEMAEAATSFDNAITDRRLEKLKVELAKMLVAKEKAKGKTATDLLAGMGLENKMDEVKELTKMIEAQKGVIGKELESRKALVAEIRKIDALKKEKGNLSNIVVPETDNVVNLPRKPRPVQRPGNGATTRKPLAA